MKTKCFLTAILLGFAMAVSAQVQVFTSNEGHGAICREKKLFLMEAGDETAIWNIVNYKKAGNKETFTLTPKAEADVTYSCVLTLNGDAPTALTMSSKQGGKKSLKLEVTDDDHLNNYYRGECGYARVSAPAVGSSRSGGVTTPSDLKESGTKSAADKVGDAAKNAFGKVKGLFKKKDKK